MNSPAQTDLSPSGAVAVDPAEPAAVPVQRLDDPSSLAWVHDELRSTLASAQKLLRRHLRESESHAGSDVSARELGSLRQARALIHQGVGATTVIGAAAATKVLAASDAALRWALEKPARLDAALVEHIEQASFAVVEFLGRELGGHPVPALWLFPQMRALLELAGAERVHPADLWDRPWQWREIAVDPAVLPRPVDERSLSAFEQLTLANIKTPSPLILARISELCAGLAAGASGTGDAFIRTLWQLAAAVFEALATGLLQADVFSKRLASRLLSLLRGMLRANEGNREALQRLAHDLLFFCAQSAPPDARRPAPRLAAVREAYGLGDEKAVDYLNSPLGSFDPALVVQARKRVASAKTVWSSVAGGEVHHQSGLGETFSLVADSLRRLFPDGELLADQLEQAALQARQAGEAPAVGLAMEVATALLYVEAALEESEFATSDPVRPIARLADRIATLRAGGRAQPLEPWIEALYARVADRQTLGTVVQELRTSLAAAEQQLDRFFRDRTDVAALRPVPAMLQSMHGVLAVLGVEPAAVAMQHMRAEVDALLVADPLQADSDQLQRLAANVGALGFLFDMLGVQPALAKAMYRFDIDSGRLLTAVSAVSGQSKGPLAADAAASPAIDDSALVEPQAPKEPTVRLPLAEAIEVAAQTQPEATEGSDVDPELTAIFSEEAAELLRTARAGLDTWHNEGADQATLSALRRCFHTLKGSARMVGRFAIGDLAWDAEQRYNARLANDACEADEQADADLHEWSASVVDRIEGLLGRAPVEPAAMADADPTMTEPTPFEATALLLDFEPDQGTATEVDLDITVPGELDFDLSWSKPMPPPAAVMMPFDLATIATDEPELEPDEARGSPVAGESWPQPIGLPPDLPTAADLDLDFEPSAASAPGGSLFWNDSVKPDQGSTRAPRVSSEITVEDVGRSFKQAAASPGQDLSFLTLDLSDDPAEDAPLSDEPDRHSGDAVEWPGGAEPPLPEEDLLPLSEAGAAVREIDPDDDPGVLDLFDGFDTSASIPPIEEAPVSAPVDFVDLALDAPSTAEVVPAPNVDDLPAKAPATDWAVPDQPPAPIEYGASPLAATDEEQAPAAPPTAFDPEPVPAVESLAPADPESPAVVPVDQVDPAQVSAPGDTAWQPVAPIAEYVPDASLAPRPVDVVTAQGWEPPIQMLDGGFDTQPEPHGGVDWSPTPWSPADTDAVPDEPLEVTAQPAGGPCDFQPPAPEAPAIEASTPWVEESKSIGPLRVPVSLFNVFLGEADEASRLLCTELAEWAMSGASSVPESATLRAHALAGNSATVGFAELSDLARLLEDALLREQAFAQSGGSCDPEDARLFSDVAEEIRLLLHQFAAGFLKSPSFELRQRLLDHEQMCQQRLFTPPPFESPAVLPAAFESPAVETPFYQPAVYEAPAYQPAVDEAPAYPPAVYELPADRPVVYDEPPVYEPPVHEPPVHEPPPAEQPSAPEQPSAIRTQPLVDEPAQAPDWLAEIEVEDRVDAELFPIFEEEAQDLLPQLAAALREWTLRPDQPEGADVAMRHLHTFKGGARLAGAMRLGELAHRLESRIEMLTAGADTPERADIEALLAGSDAILQAFERLRDRDASAYAAADALAIGRAEPLAPDLMETGAPSDQTGAANEPSSEPSSEPSIDHSNAPAIEPSTGHLAPLFDGDVDLSATSPIDWSRFQRPAPQSPASTRGSAANQQASVRIRSSLLERMVNQAGEVNMSRARIEVEMGQVRTAVGELGANLDRLRQQLHDIELQAEMQMSSRSDSARATAQAFDPLEIDRFTRLQELARMMTESVNDVATVHRSLKRNLQRTEDELAAQTRLTRELQSDLLRTRMVEFDTMAERLHRVVRQAAAESGKLVELQILDGRIELDRSVLDRLAPAFEHLLRNAVIHGIELPDTRSAAGKPAIGHLQVRLHQHGNEVSVDVVDDGAGLDIERIRARAGELGETLIEGQESELIFNPGFSTAERLTESAGRGVGLDVVRNELMAIDGQIEVTSTPGQGCQFSMLLPLTTATTQVLMLRCGDLSVAVPATLVERVRRVSEDELAQAQAVGSYAYGEHRLPLFWLGALLLNSAGSSEPFGRTRPVVVVHSGKHRLALFVDEVLGQQEAVVKNLGPQLSRLPGLAGMSMLASGAVALIYNPVTLAGEYADAARSLALHPGPMLPLQGLAAQMPLILVVDDSLTVRRVTQRLLLREGYRVELAKDGIEALEQIAQQMPQLVLSDIEMPRMDGYELVEKLRANELTAELPVVMITSRIADKHRVHAESLGVAHYLGKPYGEDELLGAVRDCLQRLSL